MILLISALFTWKNYTRIAESIVKSINGASRSLCRHLYLHGEPVPYSLHELPSLLTIVKKVPNQSSDQGIYHGRYAFDHSKILSKKIYSIACIEINGHRGFTTTCAATHLVQHLKCRQIQNPVVAKRRTVNKICVVIIDKVLLIHEAN